MDDLADSLYSARVCVLGFTAVPAKSWCWGSGSCCSWALCLTVRGACSSKAAGTGLLGGTPRNSTWLWWECHRWVVAESDAQLDEVAPLFVVEGASKAVSWGVAK